VVSSVAATWSACVAMPPRQPEPHQIRLREVGDVALAGLVVELLGREFAPLDVE
jgi:hypothetical protein